MTTPPSKLVKLPFCHLLYNVREYFTQNFYGSYALEVEIGEPICRFIL